jgi:hypothetical protein
MTLLTLLTQQGAEPPPPPVARAGGGPAFGGRAKPVLRVWWREKVDEAREEIAELVDDAAEIESAKQRRRINALIAPLNAEVLALEAAASEAAANAIAARVYRETERVERLIEAIVAAQEDDEEDVELLLLS